VLEALYLEHAHAKACLRVGLDDERKKRQACSRMRIVTILNVRNCRSGWQKYTNHCVMMIISRYREVLLKVHE